MTTAHASSITGPVRPVESHGAHVLPVKLYATIFAALVVLTGVTVGVSLLDLGTIAIYVAMTVAIVKAALVVGYFMHLKYDVRFNTLVFLSSVLFLVIFFALTMIDLGTRADVIEEQGNFVLRDEKAAAARAAKARKDPAEQKSKGPEVKGKEKPPPDPATTH